MAITARFYLTPYIPVEIGPRTPNHSKAIIHFDPVRENDPDAGISIVHGNPWKAWCVCRVSCSDQTHVDIANDPEIDLIPILDSQGVYLDLNDLVNEIDATNRQQMNTWLENRRVPTGWIGGNMQIRVVLRYIIRLLKVVNWLEANYPEFDLDSTVGDVPAAQRTAIQDWMDANGINRADFTLATPIRAVLQRIIEEYPWTGPREALGVQI